MDERQPWEQIDGEPDLWFGRFSVYLRLGVKRSVNAVFARQNKEKQGKTSTKMGPEWCNAAKTWKWEERARAYDKHIFSEQDRINAEEKERVIRKRYALMHKRVELLDRLTHKLVRMTNDESKIWIPEIRTTYANGEAISRVEKLEFNGKLFDDIDKYLAAIAAEMGERIKKKDVVDDIGEDWETVWGGGKIEEK